MVEPAPKLEALRHEGAGFRGWDLPVVTASEPACAGTPEQGLPTGVDSPAFPRDARPAWAACGQVPGKAGELEPAQWLRTSKGPQRRRNHRPMGDNGRMTILPKTPDQIEKMRVAGRLAAEVLQVVAPHVKPGV